MPITSDFLLVAAMDVTPDKEALLNEVYDVEHVPNIAAVKGVRSIARFRRRELTMMLGGQRQTITVENEPRYTAIYELESPQVLLSDDWTRRVEKGRWASQVRPFTKNRRLVLLERIDPER